MGPAPFSESKRDGLLSLLSSTGEHDEKRTVPVEEGPHQTGTTLMPSSQPPASKTARNKGSLFLSHSVYGIFLVQPKKTATFVHQH